MKQVFSAVVVYHTLPTLWESYDLVRNNKDFLQNRQALSSKWKSVVAGYGCRNSMGHPDRDLGIFQCAESGAQIGWGGADRLGEAPLPDKQILGSMSNFLLCS